MQFPERRHFSREVFLRLARRLGKTGNVQPIQAPIRVRTTPTEENIINVLAYVQYDPTLSTRKISDDLGVPKTIVHEILQKNNMHPYHIVLHQALNDTDYDQRLNLSLAPKYDSGKAKFHAYSGRTKPLSVAQGV